MDVDAELEKVNQVLQLSTTNSTIHQVSLIKVLRLQLLPEIARLWTRSYDVQTDSCHKLTAEFFNTILFVLRQLHTADPGSPLGSIFHECSNNVVIILPFIRCLNEVFENARKYWNQGFSSQDKDHTLLLVRATITALSRFPEFLDFWLSSSQLEVYQFSIFLLNQPNELPIELEFVNGLFSLSKNSKCCQLYLENYFDVSNWIAKEYLQNQNLVGSQIVDSLITISLECPPIYSNKIISEFIRICFNPIQFEELITLLIYLVKNNFHNSSALESNISLYLMLEEFNSAFSLFMTSTPQKVLMFAKMVLSTQSKELVLYFLLNPNNRDSPDLVSSTELLKKLSIKALSMSKMILSESQTYLEKLFTSYFNRMNQYPTLSTGTSFPLDLSKDLPQFIYAKLIHFFSNEYDVNSLLLDIISELLVHFHPKVNFNTELFSILDYLTKCFDTYLDIIPESSALQTCGVIKPPPQLCRLTTMLVTVDDINYNTLVENISFFPFFILKAFVCCKTRIIYLS